MTTTVEKSVPPLAAANAARQEPGLLPVATAILWTSCLVVGVIGLLRVYPRPQATPPEPVIIAQKLVVDLAPETVQPTDPTPPPPDPAAPPPLPAPSAALSLPAMIAVAEPSPAIAFALPVEGTTHVVDAKQAAFVRPDAATTGTTTNAPVPQPLIFGEGEGRQPAANYPLLARRRRQEGTVLIRFTVGLDGRVLAAEALKPSPWPLLNEAALEVVRERWQFQPGPVRVFEIPIQFVMKK